MSPYEYLLIFLALVFCGYASYTDLKTQKIRNFCSLGLLYVGTLSQLMAWYLGTTTPLYILGLFFGSGLIAFAFYFFGIFSPGDSKLFWGLCLIFPLSLFRNLSGALSFPPLILTLNIIVPYSIGLLGYLLYKFALMRNKLDLFRYFFKSNFQKAALLEKFFGLLLFIGIGSALTYLLQRVGWEPDRFLHLILVLVAFTLIQKLLSPLPKTPVYYAVVSFVCVWLAVQATPSMSVFLAGFAFFLGLYLVVFVIAKQLVLSLASVTLDNAVDVHGLQVGMIPALPTMGRIPKTQPDTRSQATGASCFRRTVRNSIVGTQKQRTPFCRYLIYRWHKEPPGAVRMLPRAVRWTPEASLYCGADSGAWISNALGRCWEYL